MPQHLFNVLANYKHESGLGAQANIQVTGPVDVTQSGYLDLPAIAGQVSPACRRPRWRAFVANGGYYQAPMIPWQYTLECRRCSTATRNYTVKFSVYNVTDRHNLINDIPFYGNDFLTRQPPTTST